MWYYYTNVIIIEDRYWCNVYFVVSPGNCNETFSRVVYQWMRVIMAIGHYVTSNMHLIVQMCAYMLAEAEV